MTCRPRTDIPISCGHTRCGSGSCPAGGPTSSATARHAGTCLILQTAAQIAVPNRPHTSGLLPSSDSECVRLLAGLGPAHGTPTKSNPWRADGGEKGAGHRPAEPGGAASLLQLLVGPPPAPPAHATACAPASRRRKLAGLV